ncbi:hypothetical protein AB0K52_02440 [Glycomyces sp. NPDC049804]|uniref:hypothetical protein n=1 Tax=Glycomyces sp. NPDC049804 TaxID=3154363 RepID=UPI0034376F77
MSDADEIRSLIGAGTRQGPPIDWEAPNRALGVTIPADFRELVDAIGPGRIGHDTLLLAPFATPVYLDQVGRHFQRAEELEMIWEDELEFVPDELTKPEVFNEPGVRPVLWAASSLGFNLYWTVREGTDPASWQIAVDPARSGTWEFLPGPATSALLKLLRGELPTRYLFSLQDAEQHYFTPAE